MTASRRREVKVTAIQLGACSDDKEGNLKDILGKIDEAGKGKTDFIVLNELSTTPYFCTIRDARYFEWAEPVPGPTTDMVAEKAKKYECCILMPLFEKGNIEGIYYNSVAVIGPDGEIIEGMLSNGEKRRTFSKVHVPEIETPTLKTDEKFYFKPGEGIPVFRTPKAMIGALICYDRRFPEAWRSLALQGAEIVFLPADVPAWVPTDRKGAEAEAAASSGDMFTAELRTRALENMFFVVACNKGGLETLSATRSLFFGMSCVINPSGKIIAQAPANESAILNATIDLEEIWRTRRALQLYKDRRYDIYVYR